MKLPLCSLAGLLLAPVAALAQVSSVISTGNATPEPSSMALPASLTGGTPTLWDLVSQGGWAMVPLGKLGSWFLLMTISYTMVAWINKPQPYRGDDG